VTQLARSNRCQGTVKAGQCTKDVLPGSKYCASHGPRARDIEMQQYLLSEDQIKTSATRHHATEEVKNLREEIALARAMVERRLNMVTCDSDFLAAVGPVNTLLITIEKLVSSCHKLETSLGDLLAKSAVVALAQELVKILVEELKDVEDYEAIIDRISNRVAPALEHQEK